MEKQHIRTGAPWEGKFSYCRAVRVGNIIEVSGTAPVKDGKTGHIGDAKGQARLCLEIIEKALQEAGASMNDVIRTRMYVTSMEIGEEVASVHGEVFQGIDPATTLVEVSALIDPDMLVEIEASAVIQ